MEADLTVYFYRNRYMNRLQLLSLCKQTALALQRVHAAGINHLDFKPDNVLYKRTEAGVVLPISQAVNNGVSWV